MEIQENRGRGGSLWPRGPRGLRLAALGVMLVLLPVVCACSGPRISHFSQFADAGTAYSKAMVLVIEESGNAAIDADSAIAIKIRETKKPIDRATYLVKQNQALRERLQLLRNLRAHQELLRSYFVALSALARSDAASGISQSAEGVVTALGKLRPAIQNAKIGDASVAQFIGPAVKIAVARFQQAALERELRARAETIERELELQQAALQALAQTMRTDLVIKYQIEEWNEVVLPYQDAAPLPSNWPQRRKQMLNNAAISIASVDAAASAARNLKLAFVALAENRFVAADLDTLIRDINEIITLIGTIKGIKS